MITMSVWKIFKKDLIEKKYLNKHVDVQVHFPLFHAQFSQTGNLVNMPHISHSELGQTSHLVELKKSLFNFVRTDEFPTSTHVLLDDLTSCVHVRFRFHTFRQNRLFAYKSSIFNLINCFLHGVVFIRAWGFRQIVFNNDRQKVR